MSETINVKMTEETINVRITIGNKGDMEKSVYDTNNNGKVDTCDFVDGGTWGA